MVRVLVYPIGGGVPVTLDFEAADSLSDALVLDLRPTDAENVLKGGATEYSFDVPQTPINRAVFDDWQNYQRDAGTAVLYRDGVLEVDGFPARLGKIALMSATDEVARLTMFFDSEDPFRALQDLRVNQLDWDIVPDTRISNMYSDTDFFTGTSNVVTIPAKLRSWPTDVNGDRVVTNADFYPCISVKSIFYQALQRTTPTAPSTLDFIQQWCGEKTFERLVIFLNKNRDYDAEYLRQNYGVFAGDKMVNIGFVGYNALPYPPVAPVASSAVSFLSNDSTDGFYDNNNNYSISTGFPTQYARYTVPYDGAYSFSLRVLTTGDLPFNGVTNTSYFYFRIKINGIPTAWQEGPLMTRGNSYTMQFSFPNIQLSTGDIVDFEYAGIFQQFLISPPFLNGVLEFAGLTIEMSPKSYSAGSNPMITGAWIPRDWSVADVFRDVFRMFNLRMFWDSVRQTMAIAPARRWYNQLDGQTYSGFMTQPETDWTDLVVEPPSEVIAERWAWDYWLLHREPADAWLKAQSSISEVRSAGGRINTGRDGAQRNEVELENGAAMAHIFDKTVTMPGNPTVMFPMLLSKNHMLDPIGQTSFNENDTLFYLYVSGGFYGSEGALYGAVRTYEITTGNTIGYFLNHGSQVPYDWDSNNNQIQRPSLAFGDETTVNGDPIPGLISNYHYGTIASANSGKLMKAYIRLSSVALQTFTFDRPIRIGSRLFEVLNINGKPAESDIYWVTLQTIDYPDAAALQWLQNPNTATYLTYDADPE